MTVLFAETLGQKQKYTDFTRIGAGIKETLFLLAKCFERRDRVILMDEPATNLHPTQIRRLMDEILSSNEHRDETGQVVVITHSPSVASLEMLSSMNKIARVDRTEYSRIVQPSRIDSDWIAENLATFHLLKPEVLFSKQIVLVEGASDKFFLNALLKHHKSSVPVDDILILDVGGISSFPKFGRFLDVFEIPYVILADKDQKNPFSPNEVFTLNSKSSSLEGCEDKTVHCFKNDLETFLTELDPSLYSQMQSNYKKKPECAYYFVKELLAKGDSDTSQNSPAMLLIKWITRDHRGMINKSQRPCKSAA